MQAYINLSKIMKLIHNRKKSLINYTYIYVNNVIIIFLSLSQLNICAPYLHQLSAVVQLLKVLIGTKSSKKHHICIPNKQFLVEIGFIFDANFSWDTKENRR